jgi:hypothetical protein
MGTEQRTEIYRQLRTSQEKYIYFLLAAAGAAITLVVHQTQEAKLGISQIPLACAVALWALSFFFGCRHLLYVNAVLYSNSTLLEVEAGDHALTGRDPQRITAASEGIRKAMETNAERSSTFARLQFISLMLGAIFYIAGHIYEMWLRT